MGIAAVALGTFSTAFAVTTGLLRAFNVSQQDQLGWGASLHEAIQGSADRNPANLTAREKKFFKRDQRDQISHKSRVRSAILFDEDAVAADKARRAHNMEANLHIEVSDHRVRVSKVHASPGFNLTAADNGMSSVP